MCCLCCYTVALSEQGIVPVPSNCISVYPAKISTRLTQWRRSTYQDFTVGAPSRLLCTFFTYNTLTVNCVSYHLFLCYKLSWEVW